MSNTVQKIDPYKLPYIPAVVPQIRLDSHTKGEARMVFHLPQNAKD